MARKSFYCFCDVPNPDGLSSGNKRLQQQPDPQGNAQKLFFNCSCLFIKPVRAMPTATFAAIAAFEVEFFCEAFVAFGRVIKIFAFDGFIFVILAVHTNAKIARFARMFLIVSKYLLPKGFNGLTVFPFVFLRARHLAKDAVFVAHEKIHIRQQKELLVVVFFIWYGLEYLFRLAQYRDRKKAYCNICFEREAYANEKDPDYLRSRSFWRFVKYL